MKEKYIIVNTADNLFFISSDWEGAYFGTEQIRLFDSEKEALDRLNEEAALFPSQFSEKLFNIQKVYSIPAP